MQPLIKRYRQFRRVGSKRSSVVGELVGYECGDCHTRWKRFQNPKHQEDCPRALRHSLDAFNTKAYYKQSARQSEKASLALAEASVRQLLASDAHLKSAHLQIANSRGTGGWFIIAERGESGVSVRKSRWLNEEWARQRGYVDVR